jgi:hypothetical protein
MSVLVDPNNIKLYKTCSACPEQYDAFVDGNRYCGYLRLRHGRFTVDDANGNQLLVAYPEGDGLFDSDERESYLEQARQAIADWVNTSDSLESLEQRDLPDSDY